MIIQICVGSSCHLKGSREIVGLMRQAVEEHCLEEEFLEKNVLSVIKQGG